MYIHQLVQISFTYNISRAFLSADRCRGPPPAAAGLPALEVGRFSLFHLCVPPWLSLYKILLHCKALVWESIILSLPPPTCKAYPIAILLHAHCAIYAPPHRPLLFMPDTMQYWAISCKGQPMAPKKLLTSIFSLRRSLPRRAACCRRAASSGWQRVLFILFVFPLMARKNSSGSTDTKGGSGGRILRNTRAKVLQTSGQCNGGGATVTTTKKRF